MSLDERLCLCNGARLLQAGANLLENLKVGNLLNRIEQLKSSHAKLGLVGLNEEFFKVFHKKFNMLEQLRALRSLTKPFNQWKWVIGWR